MKTETTVQAPWRSQSEEVIRYFLLNRRILEVNDTVYFYANAGDYISSDHENYFLTLESGIFKMKDGFPEHFCSTEGFRAMVRTNQVQGLGMDDFEKILEKQKDVKNMDIYKPYNKFVYSPDAYLLRNDIKTGFPRPEKGSAAKVEEEDDTSPAIV